MLINVFLRSSLEAAAKFGSNNWGSGIWVNFVLVRLFVDFGTKSWADKDAVVALGATVPPKAGTQSKSTSLH